MNRRLVLVAGAAAVVVGAGAVMLRQDKTTGGALTLEALTGAELAQASDILLVDIRSPEEWRASGVVEGARLITYTTPEAFLAAVRPQLQPGQRLALVCHSGNRSSRAASQIAGQIDVPVIDVQGGMSRILAEGYRPVAPTPAMGCTTC